MGYFVIYGIVALSHIVIQLVLGHVEWLRQKRRHCPEPGEGGQRPVTVVVPVYNEDTWMLRRCLESIAHQDHEPLEVIVVDDGSANQQAHEAVYRDFADRPGWTILLEPENRGKRQAQKLAFDLAEGEVIVTIDSDTLLRTPDAIRRIQRRFADERVGAVSGNVSVENKRANVLTRLISYRYWMAFNQERAAESLFGVMMCCSGPFSAYRADLIALLKDVYVSQTFLGRPCTFGDDRHLTNLVLRAGYRAVLDGDAEARTVVPEKLRAYLRQQLRWNKSFYREALWTARFVLRRNPYLGYELLMQLLLPVLLMVAVAWVVFGAIFVDVAMLWEYGVVVVAIALLRSLYGLVRTRDPGFLLFVTYGFIHLALLVPTRLYALVTLARTHWGTRPEVPPGPPAPSRARRVGTAPAVGAILILVLALLSTGFRS